MRKIKTVYGIQPILEEKDGMGLNRDRIPDRDWNELRRTNMLSDSIKEVNLTTEMKVTLIGDLAFAYGQDTNKFIEKLVEFDIFK